MKKIRPNDNNIIQSSRSRRVKYPGENNSYNNYYYSQYYCQLCLSTLPQ